jgi:TRAP-type mannitol/chloroaromatic compound transport system permease small subunit
MDEFHHILCLINRSVVFVKSKGNRRNMMKFLSSIRRRMTSLSTIDKISEWIGKSFSWLFPIASIIVVYAVIMRYVFNSPPVWGLELSLWLLIATYFISGSYTTMLHAHIRLDALYMRWSPRVKAIIDVVLTGPLLFIFSGVLIWQGGKWAWKAIVTGEQTYSLWEAPYWPVKLIVPIGAFMVLLQGIAEFIRDLRVLRGKEGGE